MDSKSLPWARLYLALHGTARSECKGRENKEPPPVLRHKTAGKHEHCLMQRWIMTSVSPKKGWEEFRVIGSCPSSALTIRAVQTRGNIFAKDCCISPAKFLYDSWEDLCQNAHWDIFKSKPFFFQPVSSTGSSLTQSMEGMSESQEFRNSQEQTHIMGGLTTQPRLPQDFWCWVLFLKSVLFMTLKAEEILFLE